MSFVVRLSQLVGKNFLVQVLLHGCEVDVQENLFLRRNSSLHLGLGPTQQERTQQAM